MYIYIYISMYIYTDDVYMHMYIYSVDIYIYV